MEKIKFVLTIFLLIFTSSNLHAQKALKLGTDDWPPYEFEKNHRIKGLSTEILSEIFNKMGIVISENKIYPWARAEIILAKGEIDALYSSTKSAKREKIAYFPSEPILVSKWVFFIRREDEGRLKYNSFEDLKGKQIGVVRGYSYTPDFQIFLKREKNYESTSNDLRLFKMLAGKRFDYIVCEYSVGRSILRQMGKQKLIKDLKLPLKETGLYIMFSRKTINKTLVDEFSQLLKDFKKTAKYKKIVKRYF